MSEQTREWISTAGDAMTTLRGRWLWVADEMVGHRAAAPEGVDSVAALLEDYAAGYDAGDCHDQIKVDWELYEDGQQISRGRHRFMPRPA